MVKTILSTSHCNSEPGTTVAGTTEFWLFGYASFEKNATESTREVLYRAPGTLSKLYVRITANSTSASSTVTIRKNAADTALTVTIGAATTGAFEETSSSVSVAAGDKICLKTVSGGTGTFTMSLVSCIWDATTNCNVRYVAKGYALTAASTTHYLPIAGDRSGTTTTEANVESTIKTAGTIKNGSVFVSGNARTTNTTFTIRDTRIDTALVITVGSGATGHRENTANAPSLAVDDETDWELTTSTGTQTLTAQSLAVDYETTTNNGVLTRGCVGTSADVIQDSLLTWYYPIGAGHKEGVTTESEVQMKAREAFTFKNLILYSGTNNVTGNTTATFRVNGADSALTLTVGAAATGFFSDTTHTVTVSANDLIDIKVVTTGAAVQSITIRQLGITTEASTVNNVVKALSAETITISEAAFTRRATKTRAPSAETVGAISDSIATQLSLAGKSIITAARNSGQATTAGATEYWQLATTYLRKRTTEAHCQIPYSSATGTLSKLYVRVTANSTTADSTIVLRKNGSDGNLVITVPAGTTGTFEDTTHTDTVSSGDLVNVESISGGTGTLSISLISAIYSAVGTTVTRLATEDATFSSASVTRFYPISGEVSPGGGGTESQFESTIKKAGIMKNLAVYVSDNARTTDITIRTRKNRANAGPSVTITPAATGLFQDTSTAVSVAVDDEIDYQVTSGTGTEILTFQYISMEYETADRQGFVNAGAGTNQAIVIGLTHFYPLSGITGTNSTATESTVKQTARVPMKLSNLSINVDANTITANTTIVTRINGADGNNTVTIGSGATGIFTDTTHTDTVASSDEIDYKIVTGATGTSINIRQLGIWTESLPITINEISRALSAETITISEAAFTRLAAKMRPIATQTTTLSENIIRIKGKLKTLATETITVGGGTIARLLAKIRTPAAIDTTTISETRQRQGSKSRPLSTQTVALSESSQKIKGAIRALATQTITVGGGTLARLSSIIRTISQTTVITDARARLKSSVRTLATQTVALSENIARTVARQVIRALATQTVSIGESIARLKASGRIISQTIILAENAARLSTKLRSIALQTVIITDNRARIKGAVKTISQTTIIITENVTRGLAKIRAIATQTVILADNVTRQIIGGAVEIIRTLTETVVLSHSVARLLSAQRVLSAETVPKAETLARVKGKVKLISQTILLTEQIARSKSALRLLSQTVIASDSINRLNALRRTVIQTVVKAENLTAETVGNLARALVETVTVSDSIIRRTAKLAIILAQTIAITEQASRLSTKLRSIIPAQTITLSDGVTNELNVIIKHALKTLSQIITLSESLTTEVIRASIRFRRVVNPSNLKLKSNHPAYLIGTKGQHDDYIEF